MTIDIQKREDANRCSSYVELVVLNYNFNEFRQHLKPFYKLEVNNHFRTGSGSCFDLKHGSSMFRIFRKPVSVLDEKKQQNNHVIQNLVPDLPKRNVPQVISQFSVTQKKVVSK
jgi:hypothetical protein